MFGKLISSAIRVTTLPLDAFNAGLDLASGGSGTKASRHSDDLNPFVGLEKLRDEVAKTAAEIDD